MAILIWFCWQETNGRVKDELEYMNEVNVHRKIITTRVLLACATFRSTKDSDDSPYERPLRVGGKV